MEAALTEMNERRHTGISGTKWSRGGKSGSEADGKPDLPEEGKRDAQAGGLDSRRRIGRPKCSSPKDAREVKHLQGSKLTTFAF